MARDKLMLHIEGDVSLASFANSLSHLSALLGEIEKDITGKKKSEVEWLVTDLHCGDKEEPISGGD